MHNLCLRPSLWLVGCLAAVALAGCDDGGGSSAACQTLRWTSV